MGGGGGRGGEWRGGEGRGGEGRGGEGRFCAAVPCNHTNLVISIYLFFGVTN